MNRDVQLEYSFRCLHETLYFYFYLMIAKFDTSSSYTNFSSEQIDFFVEGKQEQKEFSLLIFHKIRFWGKNANMLFVQYVFKFNNAFHMYKMACKTLTFEVFPS